MAALKEELAKLLNPTPVFKDPEDHSDDETTAKLVDFNEDFETSDVTPSQLRKKTVTILGDLDKKYAGKRTSRKDLVDDDDHVFSEDFAVDGIEETDEEEEEEEEKDRQSEEESSSSDGSEDDNIAEFQSKMKLQSSQGEFSFQDDGDYGKYGEDDFEEDSEVDEVGDSDNDNDDGGEGRNVVDDDDDEEITSEEEDGIQKFSGAGGDEVAKGKAAQQQLGLLDSLLEGRIKLQKAVSIINQLPQPESWNSFEEKAQHFTDEAAKTQKVLKHIMDSLVHLQDILLYQNTETKHLAGDGSKSKASSSKSQAPIDSDDEEIPSDSDEEMAGNVADDKPDIKVGKRKLKMEDYPGFLAKRHVAFQDYRDSTIQRWNDKTQLSGGKVKGKSFSAFDQSALTQINQILGDKERLIKRTQLKRSVYKVLGKTVVDDKQDATEEETTSEGNPMNQDHLKDYDPEIFDDSDFYHQLLRELIEKKTSDINDPVALSRQWLEIQKLRGKSKKKVDMKASKGRKVRYDVHSKLVNFMAPMDSCDWSDEARDDLFKSLFGKRFAIASR